MVNKRIEFNDTDESDEELEQDDKNIDENDEVEEDEEIAEESETSEDECKVMMKYDEDKRKHENGESAVNKSIKKGDREGDNLAKLWKSMDPPTSENDLTQKWFGCIFVAKKKSHLYVGKVMRRFLEEEGGPTKDLEINCLKPHVGSDTVLESVPSHLTPDVTVFPIHDIIYGPLEVVPMKSGRWNVPEYGELKTKFEICCSIDREALRKKSI